MLNSEGGSVLGVAQKVRSVDACLALCRAPIYEVQGCSCATFAQALNTCILRRDCHCNNANAHSLSLSSYSKTKSYRTILGGN